MPVANAGAQGLLGIGLEMSAGLGEQQEFIGDISVRGLSVDGRLFLNDNTTIGLSAAWNVFYEDAGVQTIVDNNVAVTGKEYRYINAYPVHLTGHYYTGSEEGLRFYAGGGAGMAYMMQRTNLGDNYVTDQRNWHIAIAPEVGVLIPLSWTNNLNIALKYNYIPGVDQSISYNYVALKIGILAIK
jgi:hypothetical protein